MSDDPKPAVGTIAWTDLTVPHAEPIRDFYQEVVGWQTAPVQMKDYEDWCMIPAGATDPTAGICHAIGSNADVPPQWLIYVVVADVGCFGPQGRGPRRRCDRRTPRHGRRTVLRDPGPDRSGVRPVYAARRCRDRTMTIQAVDLSDKLARIEDLWTPKIVAQVNDTQVKLAKIQGTFDWHSHASEDEMFLVLEGRLKIEFRDGEVWLEKGQLYVVPRGVEHRPVAPEEVHIMLVEPAGTRNTGDRETDRTVEAEWI